MSLLALGSPPHQQTLERCPVLLFGGSCVATVAVQASALGFQLLCPCVWHPVLKQSCYSQHRAQELPRLSSPEDVGLGCLGGGC